MSDHRILALWFRAIVVALLAGVALCLVNAMDATGEEAPAPTADRVVVLPETYRDGGDFYFVNTAGLNFEGAFAVATTLTIDHPTKEDIIINLKTGEVDTGGMELPEAARVFWETVELAYPELFPACRHECPMCQEAKP